MKDIIDRLEQTHDLTDEEFLALLSLEEEETLSYLRERAAAVRNSVYGNTVYMRGLIEFSNFCRNDCLYCGIRRSNACAERYRLTEEEILSCTDTGYSLGFRTFVLQSGEDMYFTDEIICRLVRNIKKQHPDCAVTLSIGEKSRESYKVFFDAGADRYLLRHETAGAEHYRRIHPPEMSFENRLRCIRDLKEIGYQTGIGMMIGSPFQTDRDLLNDLRLIQSVRPEMVGTGPFIPHKDTPFKNEKAGTLEKTLLLLSIIRLMLPDVLLPATTALGTIHPFGREMGIRAGANVVMPNLSPREVRDKYLLYDNKICTGDEAAECVRCLGLRVEKTGCRLVVSRGDHAAVTAKKGA